MYVKPPGRMQSVHWSRICFFILIIFPRSPLGIPGATTPSAAAAVGYGHGLCRPEELQREPLASAGKDAAGSGKANPGNMHLRGGVLKSKGVGLDSAVGRRSGGLARRPGPQSTLPFASKFPLLVTHFLGAKFKYLGGRSAHSPCALNNCISAADLSGAESRAPSLGPRDRCLEREGRRGCREGKT